MRRGVLVGLAVTATVVLGPAPGAQARTIKSTVELTGASFGPGTVVANGNVLSGRAACLSRRTVHISTVLAGVPTVISTDSSSLNGYWGGGGPGAVPDEIRVRMEPKRISRRARCSGDSDNSFVGRASTSIRATSPSELETHALAYAGGEVGGAGHIVSTRRCLARRTVAVFDFDDGVRGPRRAKDVSSRNGWWGAFGPSDSQGVALALDPKRLGPGQRCGGDSYRYDPDPN